MVAMRPLVHLEIQTHVTVLLPSYNIEYSSMASFLPKMILAKTTVISELAKPREK